MHPATDMGLEAGHLKILNEDIPGALCYKRGGGFGNS
jgi:hypothetical protein